MDSNAPIHDMQLCQPIRRAVIFLWSKQSIKSLSELKHFPLRLCVKLQLLLILSIKRVAGSRKGAKKRAKLAKGG